jgi:hypothetical protein
MNLFSTITSLLNPSCPSDIPVFIVTPRINSVYGVLVGGPRSYFFEERIKGFKLHADAYSTIIFIRDVIGICASLPHSCPSLIFWRPFAISGLSMGKLIRSFAPQATATLGGTCA